MGGTLREHSSTECALRVCLNVASEAGADVLFLGGKDIALPIYGSGAASEAPECLRPVDALARCDGLIVASPAYHGTISGLVETRSIMPAGLANAGAPIWMVRRWA